MIYLAKSQTVKFYTWFQNNLAKIVFIMVLHLVTSRVMNLPYFNIFASLFSFSPFLFDWIAILFLFKPRKETILVTGLSLFALSFIFAVFQLQTILEFLGEISYLLIGTYIIFSLRELKK